MSEQQPDWARPVVFFEIRGRDPKQLREFYGELFNWKIDAIEAINYGRVAPGIGGPVEGVGGGIGSGAGVSIYVQVRDLRATLAKAEELGGKKTAEPFDVPNGATIAQIADPEGNLVGLVQQ